jgi:hypothetical protein
MWNTAFKGQTELEHGSVFEKYMRLKKVSEKCRLYPVLLSFFLSLLSTDDETD